MNISKNPVLTGLQKALRVHTLDGDFMVDPAQDPLGYKNLLERQHDAYSQESRAAAQQAAPDPLAFGRNPGLEAFSRSQEDGATGVAGWNRNWAAWQEAPQVLADNTSAHVAVDYTGANLPKHTETLRPASESPAWVGLQNAAIQKRTQPVPPALPESHEAFMSRLEKKFGKR